ncbi:4-hydroxyphenylpyruvate dioxygenase [Calothrix sp. PCC 6303]|uniref:4-hydroxyphenylpyruvate dioxygenase n=1 Tax=Calothrix sp. PCC 6303 TaxID=1170562 RepID=UPI00031ADFDB|nr:4-hydroxyphenylpyruvate dioxygenase [Calothrix sp. PCC 6303]
MRIEYIHFYVEDAEAWYSWFIHILGFAEANQDVNCCYPLGKNTLEAYTKVVKSGSICFILSSPTSSTSPVAEFLRHHPPGVVDVAFVVDEIEGVMSRTKNQHTQLLQPIQECLFEDEVIRWCKVAAWGSLSHTLIERQIDRNEEEISSKNSAYFLGIDHVVLNVPLGGLENAVAWYKNILDFHPQQAFNIQTERSALHSQVMISPGGAVQLPINEPTTPNSQIQEFLNLNRGAGIQHIALNTANLTNAIAQLRQRGLAFLPVPATYYSQLSQRSGFSLSPIEIQAISQQEILVDWKPELSESVLLQIFTQPIFSQPTFFFEFIERRHQAKGFGEGNFQALFEAIEREQVKRGSLG